MRSIINLFIKNRKLAQSTVELATLGTVLVFICSGLIGLAQQYRLRQDFEMKIFRQAQALAADRHNHNTGGSSVNLQWYQSVPTTSFQNPFGISENVLSSGASVTMNIGSDLKSFNIMRFNESSINLSADDYKEEDVFVFSGYVPYNLAREELKNGYFQEDYEDQSSWPDVDGDGQPDNPGDWPNGLPKDTYGWYIIEVEELFPQVNHVDVKKSSDIREQHGSGQNQEGIVNVDVAGAKNLINYTVFLSYMVSMELYESIWHDLDLIEALDIEENDIAAGRYNITRLKNGEYLSDIELDIYQGQAETLPFAKVDNSAYDSTMGSGHTITRNMSTLSYRNIGSGDTGHTIIRKKIWLTPPPSGE